MGTSQPPEGDAGEGPSKPEKKSQVKDENLSPELIQQIVVAPTKEQLDSTLPQLQQVCDAYKALKQEWAPLLNQLHKQREEAEMFIGAWFKLQQKRDALQPVLTEANSFLKQIQDPKASPIANELTYHSQLSSDVTALEGSLKQAEKAIEDSLNVLKRAKNINSILEQSENLALLDSEISETKRRLQIFEAQLIVRDIERTYKQARDLWEKMAPHPPRGRQRSFETSPFEKENPELKKSINGIRKIYIDISLSDNALLEELNVREDHEHICETLEKLKISMTRSELAKFREYYLSLPDKAGELDLKGADFTNILGKDAVGIIQTSVTMLDAQVLALSKKPDIYRKRLYDGLLLRALRFGQQQAHQIWKYATMDRERLIQAGLEQPSEQLGSGSSEEDVTVKDYSEYMNFLDNIATSVKIDISTKSLLERITSLYNRNKMAKQNILSPLEQSHPDIQATLEDSSPFSEHDNHALTDHEEQRQLHHILDSSINESHPAKEDYNKLVETTNDDFGRIISLLDKGYDDRWKSNQHIREEMKLIQQDSDATKTLIDKNNKDNNISAKINDITIRITKLVKFADSWMEAARSVYEFKAVYDEANSWSSDKDNFDKDDYDKIEGFLDNYEDLYNRAKANKDDPFDIAKKTVEHNTSIQETKEILLDLKRQQVRSYFDTVLEVLRFSDKQILEGDWTLQSHSSVARELKTEFMRSIQEDLIRIHDTCLNKDSIPKADFTVLDKAINELSELSKKVNNLGSEKDKLSSRIKKKIFEDRQYAAKLLERLESLEKTQKEILKSGALPSTTDLLNLPANKVLRIFGLGRVQRLTDGRLKNCVFREPAHLVKLIETTEFVLKALAAGEEPSAKFIKNIARQCMENIPVWQNDFTRWIRDEGMWGYRGRGSVGFNLTDTKWSEEGYK
ncbi:MAG TPA: hypothetical protein VK553_10335, partial [Candidatus Nitrosopolaris rasttigaisensis]|nr:hypothetical protein [Candidatus Nitrosopolaris rasttigaisensis]